MGGQRERDRQDAVRRSPWARATRPPSPQNKLEREARAWELRQDEHKRRQAERVWGQLHDEVALLRRWKGGKQ